MNKEKFISKLKNKDNDAYDTLINMYSKRIYYLCLKILGNTCDAEDATQTTFLNVFRAIENFQGKSQLQTWIYKIAVNVCNDILRKKIRQNHINTYFSKELEETYHNVADEKENIEEKILKNERKKVVYNCIYKLPQNHRKFIVLRDLENLSYEEIANILDMNIGTVKSGISRARGKLMSLIKTEMGE